MPFSLAPGAGWQDMHVPWRPMRWLNWLSPDVPSSDAAAEAMVQAAQQSLPDSLTIVCLGPPSNLARAFELAPWLPGHLRSVVRARDLQRTKGQGWGVAGGR